MHIFLELQCVIAISIKEHHVPRTRCSQLLIQTCRCRVHLSRNFCQSPSILFCLFTYFYLIVSLHSCLISVFPILPLSSFLPLPTPLPPPTPSVLTVGPRHMWRECCHPFHHGGNLPLNCAIRPTLSMFLRGRTATAPVFA